MLRRLSEASAYLPRDERIPEQYGDEQIQVIDAKD